MAQARHATSFYPVQRPCALARCPHPPAGLSGFLLITVGPTFFSDNLRINAISNHPTEDAVGGWLRAHVGPGTSERIFTTHPVMLSSLVLYVPQGKYLTDRRAETEGYTPESRWRAIEDLLTDYEQSTAPGLPGIFIDSPRIVTISSLTFGISSQDPRWAIIERDLAGRNHLVYDNGPVHIFQYG